MSISCLKGHMFEIIIFSQKKENKTLYIEKKGNYFLNSILTLNGAQNYFLLTKFILKNKPCLWGPSLIFNFFSSLNVGYLQKRPYSRHRGAVFS